MSCLDVHLDVLAPVGIDVNISTVNRMDVSLSLSRVDKRITEILVQICNKLETLVSAVNTGLCISTAYANTGLTVATSIVCEVSPEEAVFYLEIEPEMIWVYPDFEVDNRVLSNTDWIIN